MMPRERNHCACEPDLTAWFQGELAPEEAARVEGHVASCEECARALRSTGQVFRMAGEVEDLLPSLRFRRNIGKLLAARTAGSRPAGNRLGESVTFLLHRLRTSPRFRLAAVSVGAHAILLLLVSLVVIPVVTEPGESRFRLEPERAAPELTRSGGPVASHEEPILPAETAPAIVREPHPFSGSARAPDLAPWAPWVPPLDRPVYRQMSGLFGIALSDLRKELRLAALVDDAGATRRTLDRALAWLAEVQEEDGGWSVSRHEERYPDTAGGSYRTGVTATVLLAFLSDGISESRGEAGVRVVVRRAVDHLLSLQVKEGPLLGLFGPASGHYTYGHALATNALIELSWLDHRRVDEERTAVIDRAIRRGIRFIERSQTPAGGWLYSADSRADVPGDTSVSIFMMMALASARSAPGRYPVGEETVARFGSFLRSMTTENGLVGYRSRERTSLTLTAGALFVEEILGLAAPLRGRQAELVLAELRPHGPFASDGLLRFYSAHAFLSRGEPVLRRLVGGVLATQQKDGRWAVRSKEDDRYAVHAGDRFLTALNVLTITSAYRYPGL